nr:hypothetical protein Itr_chr06CG06460 [Ipomoea trifida]
MEPGSLFRLSRGLQKLWRDIFNSRANVAVESRTARTRCYEVWEERAFVGRRAR